MNFQPRTFAKKVLPNLASLKITVVCLILLLVLTAWGTIYQASYGLYAAQTRFFHSWYFLVGAFFPFPGAQLVMWVLFVNLLASMIFRVKYSITNAGNILTHGGLLFLLAGSFVTYRYATESYLPLQEGEVANVSLDRRTWELAVWIEPVEGLEKKVTALEIGADQLGAELDFREFGFIARLDKYYKNSDAAPGPAEMGWIENSEGIGSLISRKPYSDPEDDFPGAMLTILGASGPDRNTLLYGGQENPNTFSVAGKTVQILLRRKRHPLPLALKLIDVRREDYSGTGIARSYESDVDIQGAGLERRTRIYMNHPLRHGDYTFFQSSYSKGRNGKETSVFAVVENGGRWIPYVSSLVIFSGMVLHFVIMMFGTRNRTRWEAA